MATESPRKHGKRRERPALAHERNDRRASGSRAIAWRTRRAELTVAANLSRALPLLAPAQESRHKEPRPFTLASSRYLALNPSMSSSLLPATSGGAHIIPSPSRPRRRPCVQVSAAASVPRSSDSVGRRAVSLTGVAAWLATAVGRAEAASPLDKYVKRKKLEPLETYVPALLLTRDQFVDLEKSLEFEKPKYDESRSLLRSGPASSLRVNIRAVAQYASNNGQGKVASDAVDECLRALEDLDSLLLRASRNDPSTSVEAMRSKMSVALAALDNLLQTVPSAVMDKGKAIADAYRTPADDYVLGNAAELDPKLKQLEDILL